MDLTWSRMVCCCWDAGAVWWHRQQGALWFKELEKGNLILFCLRENTFHDMIIYPHPPHRLHSSELLKDMCPHLAAQPGKPERISHLRSPKMLWHTQKNRQMWGISHEYIVSQLCIWKITFTIYQFDKRSAPSKSAERIDLSISVVR